MSGVRVRYRYTWRQRAMQALLVFAVVLPPRLAFGDVSFLHAVASAAAGAVGSVLVTFLVGCDADPDGITVVQVVRRRFAWSAVTGIERTRKLGTDRLHLVLDGGRRVPVGAPTHTRYVSPDPAFEEKAASIERLWRAARDAT